MEHAIKDAVTIGAFIAANLVVDEEDGDDVEVSADGGQLPNDGHFAEAVAAGPSVVQPHLESRNDDLESEEPEIMDQEMLDETVGE